MPRERRTNPRRTERIARATLLAATALCLAILAAIVGTVAWHGFPRLTLAFLSASPADMGRAGGIFPTIVATLWLALLALAVATPLGVGTAVHLAEYTTDSGLTRLIRFGADCLSGIPSIIFGLFGFVLFVVKLKLGWCLLSGALTLAIMILPTVIRTTEEAIRAVPKELREASLALGATKWRTILSVVLPSALPGIVTGVVLGLGRSVGETAAVIFTAGSALAVPESVFDSARTMAVHFYIIAREGISSGNAYATALVLLLFILAVNVVAYGMMHRYLRGRA